MSANKSKNTQIIAQWQALLDNYDISRSRSEWMEELELDERKTKILNAIIRNYLETGEPVGSRTI